MKVSVIIPCYNVEQYVTRCINSALEQIYQDIEIICVDNNSTDNTLQILKEFEEKFPNKITVLQELIKGAPAARNKGLSIAKGEWIQFLDADDELMPSKILNQVNYINTNPTIEVIISPFIKNFISNKKLYIETLENIWKGLIVSRAGCTCSNLYKKNVLLKILGWDETQKSSQEAWLLFSLLKHKSKISVFNEAETIVNERMVGSISYNNRVTNWERYIILRNEIWIFLKSTNTLNPEMEAVLNQTIFDSVRFVFKIDPKKSVNLYEKFVKNKFIPVTSEITTKNYLVLYNLIGFFMTEKIRTIITR